MRCATIVHPGTEKTGSRCILPDGHAGDHLVAAIRTDGWRYVEVRTGINWWEYTIRNGGGRIYQVTIEPRPSYCDRGHFIGKVHGVGDLDGADAFPRYYMDIERGKAELSDWLHWRVERRHA